MSPDMSPPERFARRGSRHALLTALVLSDAAMLTLAVGLAGVSRLGLEQVGPVAAFGLPVRHAIASMLALPALLLLFRLQGLYDLDHILVGTREYARVANGVTYGLLAVLAISFFGGGGPLVSRSWLVLVWALGIVCVSAGRFVARRIVRRLRRGGWLRTRVAIVGASTLGVAVAEQLRDAPDEGLDVVGFIDEYLPVGQEIAPGVMVIGRPTDLFRGADHSTWSEAASGWAPAPTLDTAAAQAAAVDEYIVVPQALPYERMEELTHRMVSWSGPPLRVVVNATHLLTHGVVLTERGSMPVVTVARARVVGVEAALKRLLDVVGAILGLTLLLLPVLVVLGRAALLRRRPLVNRLRIYTAGGGEMALRLLDRQVTSQLPIRGAPALLSVLTGGLSLVGPRPVQCAPSGLAGQHLRLTAVKPGLTGAWRLSGPDASLQDQAIRDLTYVRNYSVWEDLRILWRTVQIIGGNPFTPLLARWQEHASVLGRSGPGAAHMLAPGAA